MESNLNLPSTNIPKLNKTKIKSAFFGDRGDLDIGSSIKNIHKTFSEIFSRIRKSLIRIGILENKIFDIEKSIVLQSKIQEKNNNKFVEIQKFVETQKIIQEKNNNKFVEFVETQKIIQEKNNDKFIETQKIIQEKNNDKFIEIQKFVETQKIIQEKNNDKFIETQKIIQKKENKSSGESGSNIGNIEKSLAETNQILVKIQQELMRSSALRSKEEKAKSDREKRGASRAKLRAEESQLEKSSQKIKSSVGEKAEETVAPVKGIFGRIMDFIGTLALGIAGNAVFEWLKNPENIEKVKGWFSWIKDNWKWMAAAVGAIALLPVISTIGGLLSPIGIIVGLLAKAVPLLVGLLLNPLFLKAMLAIGAGVLIYKGGEFLFKKARNLITGGEDFSTAHSQLDKQFTDAGLVASGPNAGKIMKRNGRSYIFVEPTDPETIQLRDKLLEKRKSLYALKDEMNAEIKEKQGELEIIPTRKGRKPQGYIDPNIQARKKVDMEVRENYKSKISDIMTPTQIEARKMGGPVTAGKPYLVGEGGPEIFAPNINGSVINNMKTEKIYQMISSDTIQNSNINMINLPPVTNQLPPPKLPNMGGGEATEVPDVSSANMSDPYRQLSPMLYGITV